MRRYFHPGSTPQTHNPTRPCPGQGLEVTVFTRSPTLFYKEMSIRSHPGSTTVSGPGARGDGNVVFVHIPAPRPCPGQGLEVTVFTRSPTLFYKEMSIRSHPGSTTVSPYFVLQGNAVFVLIPAPRPCPSQGLEVTVFTRSPTLFYKEMQYCTHPGSTTVSRIGARGNAYLSTSWLHDRVRARARGDVFLDPYFVYKKTYLSHPGSTTVSSQGLEVTVFTRSPTLLHKEMQYLSTSQLHDRV
ncbi:hypothetical protein J6590_047251 [Homalodisca vitripennis]|nr:hypothetical protein J6590_047251 [Homalodisca vitripennis]